MSETLSELLNVPTTSYLEHLTSLDLETLLSEPRVLQTQSHHLTSSLTSLTHASYPTFVSLYTSTSDLTSSLSQISSSLNSLLNDSLPALESSVSNWNTKTSSVLATRRKTLTVLENHDKLRDLLDIPILINTCARNAYFSEALSLAAHARRLIAVYPSPVFILKSVLAEVDVAMNQMLISLLTMLHEPNKKLPALWKAVNFLRKMEDAFGGEDEIALAFLSGRELCLKGSLENLRRDIFRIAALEGDLSTRDKDDLAKYLGKYIGLWREGVYDLVTQYESIFLASAHEDNAFSTQLHALLKTYVSHVFRTHLLPLFATSQHSKEPPITSLPIASLPSLVTQLTYCAVALGRVGADFRFSVARWVSDAVTQIFSREILFAEKRFISQFERNLGSNKEQDISSSSISTRKIKARPPSKWLLKQEALDINLTASPSSPVNSTTPSHTPPSLLTTYTPLAVHANEVIEVLNALRACAPFSAAKGYKSLGDVGMKHSAEAEHDLISSSNGPGLIHILEISLVREGQTIFDYVKNSFQVEEESLMVDSRPFIKLSREPLVALAFARAFFETWVPWVTSALAMGVFGLAETSLKTKEKSDSELDQLLADWQRWTQKVSEFEGP
ncbi:Dor1-like family-domain-containing protein [Lentinula aff. detonsa]|uniref:Conserved oligomeric Golgi complex subunit 8 n=1 Tax=Lentinula aff. detonsa TaxID=2804958 RepID=A0AA38NRF0_9AGAR|nr:Dor1-like family-domain-containing protein [Lentinula aff. detonsa]KAJ3802545.1 Dor1-like family-domain-containing protein [Lentinula aff. detonsa]